MGPFDESIAHLLEDLNAAKEEDGFARACMERGGCDGRPLPARSVSYLG